MGNPGFPMPLPVGRVWEGIALPGESCLWWATQPHSRGAEAHHRAVYPPSTTRACPVTNDAASEQR